MEEKITELPFKIFNAGDKTYLLRLTALAAVRLEERLGCSVYEAVERMSEIRVMSEVLYALIESSQPEFRKNEVYGIIDSYLSEGKSIERLNGEIGEALRLSGFFGIRAATEEVSSEG